MPLGPNAQQKVVNWLATKCTKLTCAGCGQTGRFAIGDAVVPLLQMNYDSGPINVPLSPGKIARCAPFIPLVCPDCRLTVFLTGDVAGFPMLDGV